MNDFISFAALAKRRLQNYAFAIAALVLGTGLFLLIPRTLGTLIETIGDPEGLEFNVLIAPVGLIAAILIAQAILSAIHNYLVTLSAEQIGNELRATFFVRLIDQPYAQTLGQKLNGIASEFVSDIAIMQSGLSTVLIAFLRHAVFTIGAFVAMFIVNWQMALISIASVLVVAGVISVFIHFATKASILDEATASLDVISERAIRDALLALRGQTTIVGIAHQGELLSIADHLLVLGNGRLEFAGNPQASSQSNTIAAYLPHLGNKPQMNEVDA